MTRCQASAERDKTLTFMENIYEKKTIIKESKLTQIFLNIQNDKTIHEYQEFNWIIVCLVCE